MRIEICVGGSGGQGILLFGNVITYAAFLEGKNALCIPSYGAEARGGEVSCFVILSDSGVKSPFPECFDYLIFFNRASFDKFREHLRPGATLLHSSSEADDMVLPEGIRQIAVPFDELMTQVDKRCVNMAMLGVFIELTGILDFKSMGTTLRGIFKDKGDELIASNLEALEAGRHWGRDHRESLTVTASS